jgi:hypothetical protein
MLASYPQKAKKILVKVSVQSSLSYDFYGKSEPLSIKYSYPKFGTNHNGYARASKTLPAHLKSR